MKTLLLRSSVFALCFASLGCLAPLTVSGLMPATAAPAASPQPPAHAPSNSGSAQDPELDADEQKMLVLINQHRADHGAQPLRINALLAQSSRWLSQDMAARSYLRHTDSLGRDSFERMDSFGFMLNGWRGENIACGNGDANATYLQWLNSPGHNANMLDPHYSWIGIARAYEASSEYGWYWTTDFGSDPEKEPQD